MHACFSLTCDTLNVFAINSRWAVNSNQVKNRFSSAALKAFLFIPPLQLDAPVSLNYSWSTALLIIFQQTKKTFIINWKMQSHSLVIRGRLHYKKTV